MRRFRGLCLTLLLAASNQLLVAEAFKTFRSEDGGRSWEASSAGLPRFARVNAFGQTATAILAATDQGIFISRDHGQTWNASPDKTVTRARPLCFATLRETVLVGTHRAGILASHDHGESWAAAGHGLASGPVRSLLAVESSFLAGMDLDGVYRSEDGTNWIHFGEGLPDQAQVHQMAHSGRTVFAALYSKGLYRRTLDTEPWRRVGDVTPLAIAILQGTFVAGHNPGGLHTSRDNGEHWTPVPENARADALNLAFPESPSLSQSAPVWVLAANSRGVFAGAAQGLFFSANPDRAWTRAIKGLPSSSPAIAILANDQFVLATVILRTE